MLCRKRLAGWRVTPATPTSLALLWQEGGQEEGKPVRSDPTNRGMSGHCNQCRAGAAANTPGVLILTSNAGRARLFSAVAVSVNKERSRRDGGTPPGSLRTGGNT